MKKPAGILRRFGAMIYDFLLIFALSILATIPFVALQGGEAVNPETLMHQFVVGAVAFAFLVGFWVRRGSTLGMLAWGLRVEQEDGSPPVLSQGAIRFFVAILSWLPLGLGFWWQLWDKDKMTWHDRASSTRLMYYPKKKQSS